MTLKRRLGLSILSLGLLVGSLEIGSILSVPGFQGVVTPAHAIIGRPLTPISVAGVARRTARRTTRRMMRRCAAGIYYC